MSDGDVGWVWCLALDMDAYCWDRMGVLVFLGLGIFLEGCSSVSYYKSSDFLWVGITGRGGIGAGGTYVLTGAMTLDSSYLNINIELQRK